ncbi:P-loop containing nucleoside triphosphate hydrolases superfamily protein [Artemisia annua]|uniref:P-loop containing nucleoside triphosphate hydrolases superfamily protein n=1 Tax=Artemisia annua TaxID=35608 RepID=A0A2U1Q4H3_ARTAN|nr:P-loop containing nucleoside triphosphate hydrolases superfamily protein [Artemisia annua]
MENSPNSETKPRVRRRLIQSTLFPHKSPENVVCVDDEIEPIDLEQGEGDDECGGGSQSQSAKSKKRKPKPRASRKVAANGNEIGGKDIEEVSPSTTKVDFFAKVSEKRQQQRKKKEPISIQSPEKIEQSCTPSDVITNSKSPRKPRRRTSSTPKKRQTSCTPEKRQRNATPSKNASNGAQSENSSDVMLASPPKPIPDLRLEAKKTAEENSRIFAGKQIHPFFSSRKFGKKNTENTSTENNWCHVERKGGNNDFSPVHIFEKKEGETFSVDWRNWTFSESISTKTSQDLEDACLQQKFKGSVNCLDFDNFLDIQNIEVGHEIGKTGDFFENSELDTQWQDMLLSKRMASNYHDCSYQPENCLWTTKYQPEKAIEICGNFESVKLLNEWLHLWQEKGSRTNRCPTDNDNQIMQDIDLNYCPSDSGSDTEEETNLKNVLLVTGPVGSGKSAAIYACAKEQGFQVIEVNTSDWRNGALVKQKFGEAVESHWLQSSMPNPENPDNKSQLKSTPTKRKADDAQRSADVIDLISLSDDEDSKNGAATALTPVSSQNGIKTLILFEDVDATLFEDRGFIATIQQLAETAKRPMILTSNSDDPDLPNNLDRIEVCFRIPSSEELLNLAYMVCAAEKAKIEPVLVERFIDHCQGDIRKSIMLLQFWCQGQYQKKDSEVQNTYAPLVFDTNAGHHVLPQMIPCGHTSKLSEMIESEITKSTLLIEKDATLMEIIEEEEEDFRETQDIDAKKDEMLRMHGSDQDGNEFAAQCNTTNELPSCSNSPVASTRRTLQRKYDAEMSSDSGHCWNEGLFDINDIAEVPVDTRNARRKYNAVVSSDSEEECLNDGLCNKSMDINDDEFFHVGNEQLEDTCHPSEVPSFSNINGVCKSGDVSCVPESSYVPDTVIENGTMMYSTLCSSGHVDGGVGESPTNTDCAPINMVEEDKVSEMVRDLGLDTAPVHGEEIGDSHVEPTEDPPRDYQMMDECSRIDFSRKAEFAHGPKTVASTDIVQETWRRLRNCSKELSQYVSIEEKDTLEALGISYGMTNLISEADLLLADCQSLTCDYIKPSMFSSEKSQSSSWHDDQLQIASTFAQHGFCLYAKKCVSAGINGRVDLVSEMLAASTNAASLGKLINQNDKLVKSIGNKKLQSGVSSKSMLDSPLCNTVQSIVPLRSQLSLKGYVFHEYLSSLSQISRSESSRLSEANNRPNQRRKRVARNYLSNGALSLPSEDISLLDQYSCYQKHSSETNTES